MDEYVCAKITFILIGLTVFKCLVNIINFSKFRSTLPMQDIPYMHRRTRYAYIISRDSWGRSAQMNFSFFLIPDKINKT